MWKVKGLALQTKVTLLLDNDLAFLEQPFRDLGLKIITIGGLSDRHFRQIVEGTAILTMKSEFIKRAMELDYDVILLSELIEVKEDQTAMNLLAEKVTCAVRESAFYCKRGNWLLQVNEDGSWSLKEIVI
jgi:hypothetical protein